MKKGFTLIEVVVSIFMLGLISVAIANILPMLLKDYRLGFQKATFQRNINIISDRMERDIKDATTVEGSGGGYSAPTYAICSVSASPTTLILGLPSIDAGGNFLYASPTVFKKDLVIYTNSSGSLKRIVVPDAASSRKAENKTIQDSLSTLGFDCSVAKQVSATITLSKNVGQNVSVSTSIKARLRNAQ